MRENSFKQAENSLGLIFFPAFDWEIAPAHPERRERLLYTRDQIFEEGILDDPAINEYNPEIASRNQVESTHICAPSCEDIVSRPHLISAGGAIRAARLVEEKTVERAFALIRPPGHHAFRVVHGARGFCTVNNEAIMVDELLRDQPDLKIAFVDTDAHHADGTQEIFYHNPQVLHISIHQDGRTLFPGSGFTREAGGPGAYGRTLNVPLPPGTGDKNILFVLENLVRPILDEFNPDLIINAAGQDNHFSDPITNMNVTARGYGRINEIIEPDLAVLQGGYAIESALPYVNLSVILAMAGLDYSEVKEPELNSGSIRKEDEISEEVKKKVNVLQDIWQSREEIIMGDEFQLKDDHYYREKNLHYDTDNIRERQEESVKACSRCSGFIDINSQAKSSFPARRIRALILPHDCCNECRMEARERWLKINEQETAEYDFIAWQDKARGEYRATS